MAAGRLSQAPKGIGEAVVTRLREAGVKVLTTARTTPAQLAEADLFVAAELDSADTDGCPLSSVLCELA
jgi:NAD(P)-dependent dehydrogenase (short-subunit alcohol dehydrogenase family)